MRRKNKIQVKEDVTCNLIPMVDIMFLLLLFFILGADMTQREQAELVLPTASEIKESEKVRSATEPLTTVNIQHRQESGGFQCPVNKAGGFCRDQEHWLYVIRAKEYPHASLKDQLKIEADESLEPDIDPQAGVRLSARKVIIRADRTAPYGDIQKVIETCGQVGIYKIEVGAAVPTKT
jgi:biopolymer transport protein ExbD